MKFEEWWEKKAPDINKALKNNHDYIKPFFENAYIWGRAAGEKEERERTKKQYLTNPMHSDGEDRCMRYGVIAAKGGDEVPTVKYKYDLDQRVTTPFGDPGIVTLLGFDDSGPTYYVKTRTESNWFKEKELKNPGAEVLTEG